MLCTMNKQHIPCSTVARALRWRVDMQPRARTCRLRVVTVKPTCPRIGMVALCQLQQDGDSPLSQHQVLVQRERALRAADKALRRIERLKKSHHMSRFDEKLETALRPMQAELKAIRVAQMNDMAAMTLAAGQRSALIEAQNACNAWLKLVAACMVTVLLAVLSVVAAVCEGLLLYLYEAGRNHVQGMRMGPVDVFFWGFCLFLTLIHMWERHNQSQVAASQAQSC